jgi:hypothetical protein
VNPADRAATLERERRFMTPAGIASIVGVVLIAIGVLLRTATLDPGLDAAEALIEVENEDLGGKLVLAATVLAIGFLLLAAPLTVLFLAARDRSDRVRSGMVGLAVIGAIFVAVSGLLNGIALSSAADDFAVSESERAAEESSGAADAAAEERDTEPGELGGTERQDSGGGSKASGAAAEGETTVEPTTTTTDTSASGSDDEESAEDEEDAANERAEDALDDAGSPIGGFLAVAGIFAFAVGFFYTSLWAMRTGLLTRFWGSLGMACAVVFVLLAGGASFAIVFQELWFLGIGLMFLGFLVRRPPAWESGTAIPWPKPGQDVSRGERDSIEGEGRDVTGEPLEPDDGDSSNGSPPSGGSGPKRKRKRRR